MPAVTTLTSVRKRVYWIALIIAGSVAIAASQGGVARLGSGHPLVAAAAAPHVQLFVSVKGRKQGDFKGDSLQRGHLNQMTAISFDYGIVSPRDLATGQASGKRQHKPVTISKEWGASMPQFLQAAATNETLTTVKLEFDDVDARGASRVHYLVTLTDASISEIKESFANDTLLEQVSFTFRKITIDDKVSNTSYSDDWLATL